MQGLCLFLILWRYPSCHYLVPCLCWVARLRISCLEHWGIFSLKLEFRIQICTHSVILQSLDRWLNHNRLQSLRVWAEIRHFQIWPCLPLNRPYQLPLVVTLITKEVFGHCRSCPWAWLKPCCVNTVMALFLWYLWKSNPFLFLPLCCCVWSPCNYYINFQ